MDKFHFRVCVLTLFCVMLGITATVKISFADIPTTDVPLFRVLSKEITSFAGGVNITLTFQNYGYRAESGTVWIPWEKVWYSIPLSGDPPQGNISEAILPFDVNGDGDTTDVFTVEYIDNKTALIDEMTIYAVRIPEQLIDYDNVGAYWVCEKNDFTLGLKNHTLYRVRYDPAQDSGYAAFGLESFFRNHPSPNIEFVIECVGESIDSPSTAEITCMELNGVPIQCEFNWVSLAFDGLQWYVDNVYVYPLGSVENGATFTVKLTVMGDPAAYMFHAIVNWSPDNLHRYQFFVWDACDIPCGITGTVYREVNFGGESYHIDILTNSTVLSTISFNSTAKEISFDVAIYPGYPQPATYFWNVSIPQNLLTDNPWVISLDNETIPFISTTNGTHTFLHFNYSFQYWFITHTISIKGTWAVPEATSNVLLPIFIITSLFTSILCKKKQLKRIANTSVSRC